MLEAVIEQIEVFLGLRAGDQAALNRLLDIIERLEGRITELEVAAELVALGDRIQGFVSSSSAGSAMSAVGGIDRYGPLAGTGGADSGSFGGFVGKVTGTVAQTGGADTSAVSGTVT